jgi:hypothetical protein
MQNAHIIKNIFLKFVNFGNFLLTRRRKYDIIKVQIGRNPNYQGLKKEDTPMQNLDEPFHFSACRDENDNTASVLCIAAGPMKNLIVGRILKTN